MLSRSEEYLVPIMRTRRGGGARRNGDTTVILVSGRRGTSSQDSGWLKLDKLYSFHNILFFAEIYVLSLTRGRICSTCLTAGRTRKLSISQSKSRRINCRWIPCYSWAPGEIVQWWWPSCSSWGPILNVKMEREEVVSISQQTTIRVRPLKSWWKRRFVFAEQILSRDTQICFYPRMTVCIFSRLASLVRRQGGGLVTSVCYIALQTYERIIKQKRYFPPSPSQQTGRIFNRKLKPESPCLSSAALFYITICFRSLSMFSICHTAPLRSSAPLPLRTLTASPSCSPTAPTSTSGCTSLAAPHSWPPSGSTPWGTWSCCSTAGPSPTAWCCSARRRSTPQPAWATRPASSFSSNSAPALKYWWGKWKCQHYI